eukprot:jgi/Picre1/30368/NNA_005732.t1
MASGAITKSLPTAKVAAEQALQKRASMTYSKDTVADVAKATKVASKRLRTALVAANGHRMQTDSLDRDDRLLRIGTRTTVGRSLYK